jgi:hypothetical protein
MKLAVSRQRANSPVMPRSVMVNIVRSFDRSLAGGVGIRDASIQWTQAMQRDTEVLGGLEVGHKSDVRCRYDPQPNQDLIRQCMKPGIGDVSCAPKSQAGFRNCQC